MSRLVLCILGVLAALVALAVPVSAQPGKKAQAAIERFASNNALFVLYHEVGHLLIDQLGFPVLGREEDAADNIATWIMLRKGTAEAHQGLSDAAYGWLLSGLAYGAALEESDYYSQHSLDKQRAFQIVCLMVGSDNRAFRAIANRYAIDRFRQDSCRWDYDLVDRAMRGLVESHVDRRVRSGGVHVTYQTASGALAAPAEAFRRSGVFDRVASEVGKLFPMPRHVRFNARRCGESNAFYDPDTVEIIFCYELMAEFLAFATADLKKSDDFDFAPALPRPSW